MPGQVTMMLYEGQVTMMLYEGQVKTIRLTKGPHLGSTNFETSIQYYVVVK